MDFRAIVQPSPSPRTLNMLQDLPRVQRYPWWRFGEFPPPSQPSMSFQTPSTPITPLWRFKHSLKRRPRTVVTSRIDQKDFTAKELSFLSVRYTDTSSFCPPKHAGPSVAECCVSYRLMSENRTTLQNRTKDIIQKFSSQILPQAILE
jgi:hypothetical protein